MHFSSWTAAVVLFTTSADAFYPYSLGSNKPSSKHGRRFFPWLPNEGDDTGGSFTLDIKKHSTQVCVKRSGFSRSDVNNDDIGCQASQPIRRCPSRSSCNGRHPCRQPGWLRLLLFCNHDVWFQKEAVVDVDGQWRSQYLGHGVELSERCLFNSRYIWPCRFRQPEH